MIHSFQGKTPKIHANIFLAPSADVIGDVEIGNDSSVWFNTVIRGDVHFIRIGERTNIQDLSILHVTRKTHPLIIGNDVTVGHHVTLHGCTISNRVLIGMGAVLLDGAVISDDAIVGAGALVTEGMIIPPFTLVIGVPAKIKRGLTEEEIAFLRKSAQNYVELAQLYIKG
ncbi:MAG: gamma carbonic anhydrase family protein [Nitrospirae bacterium]|nr:gamma carbonic anhydrase family protein [Candidatus Troglogloeales bacterium]